MIDIKEVSTKKQQKQFVDFPTKLYKKCPYYVHPLRMDEFNLFNPKKNVSYDDCDIVFYLAEKDGKVVGRICGIEQKLYNKKQNEKRVRFTRFDCINDIEVAKALIGSVEKWAKSKGMEIVHGPLGFNDLDREGLLVDGFDQLSTFEADYSYPYYAELLEKCGYSKEVDWLEFKVYPPKEISERIVRLSEVVAKRYKLHIATAKNMKEYLEKYQQGIFDTIDAAYGSLYGVIPYTKPLQEQILSQFKLLLSLDCMVTIVDENEKVVAYGLGIPSLAKAVQKSKGKMTIAGITRLLWARKHMKVFDFGLIAIRPEYQGQGITAMIFAQMFIQTQKYNLEYCETNHSLEDNYKILLSWKNFQHEQHKRRRCYWKHLNEKQKVDTKKSKKVSPKKEKTKTTKALESKTNKKIATTQKTKNKQVVSTSTTKKVEKKPIAKSAPKKNITNITKAVKKDVTKKAVKNVS